MADYGIKIAKPGKSVTSPNVEDYIFSSKYQSLPFLYKTVVEVTVPADTCEGTETYTHNLGFFPFVLSEYERTSGPAKPCDIVGGNFTDGCTIKIKENTIEVTIGVVCTIPQIGTDCPDAELTYEVTLWLYMFELGS